MKIIDLLKNNIEFIKNIRDCGIRLDDIDYISMYSEYEFMHMQGEKKTYIIKLLSERYFISERKIYKIIKKFSSNCKLSAVL